jgi:hypothetical protein
MWEWLDGLPHRLAPSHAVTCRSLLPGGGPERRESCAPTSSAAFLCAGQRSQTLLSAILTFTAARQPLQATLDMPPLGARSGGAAAALLLLGLLLLSSGPRLASANVKTEDSPSPSPSPSDSPTLGAIGAGGAAEAPMPAAAAGPDSGDLIDSDVTENNVTLSTASDDGSSGSGAPAGAPAPAPKAQSDNAEGLPLLTPSTARIKGRDVYYEVPKDPKGLLVFFHGCFHNAYDFWPEQEACTECRGEGPGRQGDKHGIWGTAECLAAHSAACNPCSWPFALVMRLPTLHCAMVAPFGFSCLQACLRRCLTLSRLWPWATPLPP